MNNNSESLENNKNKEINIKEKNTDNEKEKKTLDISILKSEIEQHKKELKEIKLRAQAEIENIRRRTEIDIEKAYKFSLEKLINELLPIIDSLEKPLELNNQEKKDVKIITEGIKLTLKALLNIVKKFGVEVINDVNVQFNPEIHQAISTIDSDQVNNNHIIKVVQKGYTLNGRLLRPSMVIVSKKII